MRYRATGVVALSLFFAAFGCKGGPPTTVSGSEADQPDPIVTVRGDDYAKARQTFTTKLLWHVPAPQEFASEPTPVGAKETTFKSGGLELKAWVSAGDQVTANMPAVLFLHGGFAVSGEDWDMTKPFRDAGYVVMMPFLRGENGMPGDFSMFYHEVDDVIAAGRALSKAPGVDSARVFVAGHSTGGTLTMLAAQATDVFAGAASFSGSPDQVVFCADSETLNIVPFDPNSSEEYEMRSPLAFAKSFKCPARLYYGNQEPFFHKTTLATAQAAGQAGLDVKSVIVRGDHFSAIDEEISQAVAFFGSLGNPPKSAG